MVTGDSPLSNANFDLLPSTHAAGIYKFLPIPDTGAGCPEVIHLLLSEVQDLNLQPSDHETKQYLLKYSASLSMVILLAISSWLVGMLIPM